MSRPTQVLSKGAKQQGAQNIYDNDAKLIKGSHFSAPEVTCPAFLITAAIDTIR